jgi:serine phosphatase RsbU (regulator of sigma subunit)
MNLMATEIGTAAVRAPDLDRALDLTLAGRCIPAGRTGKPIAGDFYEARALDDHRLLIAVGDASGHGVGAGCRMRELRGAVRRAARWASSPIELLSVLDETYVLGNDDDIATVWIGVYDKDTSLLQYASAGHPPPVMTDLGGTPRLLEPASAPPLGTGAVAAHARAHELLWPAGSLLVAYSDGLVERRDRDLEDQIDQLRRLVGFTGSALGLAASPAMLAKTLVDAMAPDQSPPLDDICILVVRRDPTTAAFA